MGILQQVWAGEVKWSRRLNHELWKCLGSKDACWRCGAVIEGGVDWRHIERHHLVPKSFLGPDELWNLAKLCINCHKVAHKKMKGLLRGGVDSKQYQRLAQLGIRVAPRDNPYACSKCGKIGTVVKVYEFKQTLYLIQVCQEHGEYAVDTR